MAVDPKTARQLRFGRQAITLSPRTRADIGGEPILDLPPNRDPRGAFKRNLNLLCHENFTAKLFTADFCSDMLPK